METHLEIAIKNLEEYGKSSSKDALINGLRAFADAIEHNDKGPNSAIDIQTNNELTQTISSLKAVLEAFSKNAK